MRSLTSYLALCVTVVAVSVQEGDGATAYEPVELPAGYTSRLDVVYTEVNGWKGRMDLYLPAKDKGASPAVINIHGGGWRNGAKESQTGFSPFFEMGYAVANIEYRLTGQAPAPAAVEDTRCALVYLIENAKNLNIDADKIVIMGGSAGGHLALMGGLLGKDHRFDGNCPNVADVKVAAIVDKCGITDVWDWSYGKNITSKSAIRWLGDKATDRAFARSVSPISYVTGGSPPIFIVHGDADPVVPYQQSVDLHEKLKGAGVKTAFFTVPGGRHGDFGRGNNAKISDAIAVWLKGLGGTN